MGVFSSVFENGCSVFPCDNWNWLTNQVSCVGDKQHFLFPRNILVSVRATIKWMVSSTGLDPAYFPAPSLGAAGSPTSLPDGIESGIIRRFGRWRSIQFHIYLYGDITNSRNIIASLRQGNELIDHIRTAGNLRSGNSESPRIKIGRGGQLPNRVGSKIQLRAPTVAPTAWPSVYLLAKPTAGT